MQDKQSNKQQEQLRALRLPTAARGLRGAQPARPRAGSWHRRRPSGGRDLGGPGAGPGGWAAGPSRTSRLGAASSGQHCSSAQPLPPHALTGGQAAGTAAASSRAAGWRVSFCSSMAAPGTGGGDGGRWRRESAEPAYGRSNDPATAVALVRLPETRAAASAAPGVTLWHLTLWCVCATRARAASPRLFCQPSALPLCSSTAASCACLSLPGLLPCSAPGVWGHDRSLKALSVLRERHTGQTSFMHPSAFSCH